MPLSLELPIIQNWSCHNCGGCCRQHAIEITPDEQARIQAQGWSAEHGIPAGQPLFTRLGPFSRKVRLAHQPDGACVFLNAQGLCRIHARFGEPAKPLACRVYPFVFHPAGKKVAVGLRFSCPSVAANKGREVIAQQRDLRALQTFVVPEGTDQIPPPPISPGQQLDWRETRLIVAGLERLVSESAGTFAIRLIKGVFVAQWLGQAQFEKVRGERVAELVDILSTASESEVPAEISAIPEPTRVGRTQFRLLCAQYARKDTFAETGLRYRWKLFVAALRFARGRGLVPPLQSGFTPVPFAVLEQSFGTLTPEIDELLTRFLRVKLQSLHFCGPAYYGTPVIEGFLSLAVLIPAVLWLARWAAASAGRTTVTLADAIQALTAADHHHGYSPALGQPPARGRLRLLTRTEDISRLIAWYSR